MNIIMDIITDNQGTIYSPLTLINGVVCFIAACILLFHTYNNRWVRFLASMLAAGFMISVLRIVFGWYDGSTDIADLLINISNLLLAVTVIYIKGNLEQFGITIKFRFQKIVNHFKSKR